jgi:HK97 family phage major capsid protein
MSDMNEVKSLIETQGAAWEQFRKTNDARLAAIEAKQATGDFDAQLAKLNEVITANGKQIDELSKKANRFGPAGDGGSSAEQEEHKRAFLLYARKGIDTNLREIERKAAMNSTSDPDGGYMVIPELDRVIDRVVPTISAMARVANVVTIGTRAYQKRVQISGMTVAWPGEGATAGESTEPRFAQVEVVVHPIEVEPWVNNETLEDADVDLAALLANEAAISFGEGEGAAFISGNGVGKPRGLTAYTAVANASYAWGSIGYIASGKSAAFASVAPADKILDLQHSLKSQYRSNARWMMSDAVLNQVRQMKDGTGQYYLWQPDPAAGFGGRVLGSPVEIDDNMPALAASSLSMAYGDFARAYTIVQRTGTGLIRDNVTSKGVTKFNFRRRVGGGIVNYEAVKVMRFNT